MRESQRALGAWVVLTMLGCGGSNQEAQSPPPATAASLASVDSSGQKSPGAPEAASPASSPELAAGIQAFDQGNYVEARKAFEAARAKNPKNHEAQYDLGQACEKLGDRVAAEEAYKSALGLKPDFDAAAVALGSLYLDLGRADDAVAVTRSALAKRENNPSLHENLGVALAVRGDADGARPELERAVKLDPSQPMLELTLAHWLNAWRVRGAAPHLDAALVLAKDDYPMIVSIGFEYRMAGDFESCIKTFDRAIKMKDGAEARTDRALCRHGLSDDQGMLDDLQAAVAREPGYATAHYYLGGRLAVAKRFKEAAAEYAKYLELAPAGSLAKPAAERLKETQEAAKANRKK